MTTAKVIIAITVTISHVVAMPSCARGASAIDTTVPTVLMLIISKTTTHEVLVLGRR
jgi:hypothetical protein